MLPNLLIMTVHAVAAIGMTPAVVSPADPEPPLRLVTQYKLDRWTDTDGLPQNALHAVAQTTDRFLWFASEEGLIRFDGGHFVVYNAGNTSALRQSQMLSLAAGGEGELWIGTAGDGLVKQRRGNFTVYRETDGLPSNRVQAVVVDDAGVVWVGTNRGLARIDRDNRITRISGLPNEDVNVLAVAAGGGVWVGTPEGLVLHTPRAQRTFTTADGLPHDDVRALSRSPGGGLWVGTMSGLARFDGTRFTIPDGRLARLRVTSVSEDADGAVWFGSNGVGLQRWRAGRLEQLHGRNGGADMILGVLHDAEGNLWVTTNGSGLLRLRAAPIIPLGTAEGLSDDITLAVMQTRDGSRWVGTAGAGLNRIARDGSVRNFGARDGLTASRVLSLAELPEGDVLVGAPGALFRYQGGRFSEIGKALGVTGLVMAILPDRRGGFWLGTTAGLIHVGADGTSRSITAADGLVDNFIMTLHLDGHGGVWIGTRSGVSRVLNDRVVPFSTQPDLAGTPVGAFFDPGNGSVWAATQGRGVVRLDGPGARFLNTTAGLCEEMVHAIVADDDGGAWMSSNRGIFRVALAELQAYFGGTQQSVRCRMFDRGEGMRSREANGGFMPAGARLDDGRIMFPTMQGVVSFDPKHFAAAPLPPPPTLRYAVMDADTAGLWAESAVRVGTNRRDLEIEFTAPFYRDASRLQFRYRLDGFESEWRDAGARRSAHYTNLPPGDYVFRVMAGNEEGEWHPDAATVNVTVPHRLHETWWFQLIVLIMLIVGALTLHRARTLAVQRGADRLQELVEERSRAEQRYRDLFENASDMVFTTDRDGVITSWNHQAVTLTGWSAESVIGRNVADVLPHIGSIANTSRRDLPFRTRTGETGVVEIATRLMAENGTVTGYQVTGRDMLQWRHLQTQLQNAAKMEAVGQLAGGIAHDFNNLLTVISSSSEIIDSDLPPASPLRSDVQQIRAAADSAAGLTRQLLAFSRRQVLQPRVVNVNGEVVKVITMLRRIIGVDIHLETELAPDVWTVCADGSQLEQVLMNLALNARDAMPEGGTLRFRTTNVDVTGADDEWLGIPSGSYVVLNIEDTGLGISEDVLPHLFEPFFTTKEAGRGTGLGLATVYGVVKQSGGHILVDSTPGEGTRFRIFLPRCLQDAPAQAVHEKAATPDIERDAVILLAEDEPAVRKLAERILAREGFRVLSAGTGGEALAVLDEIGQVDMLLTDIVMPGMNGRQLAQRVQERDPSISVLYMSGYTEDEAIRGGTLSDGEHFLPKPFTPRDLVDAVAHVLNGATAGRS
jgi:PAS domain S-box-containing protein